MQRQGEQPWRAALAGGGGACVSLASGVRAAAASWGLGVLGVLGVLAAKGHVTAGATTLCACECQLACQRDEKKTRQLGSGTGETVQNKASRKAEGGQVLVFAGAARSMRMDNPEGWEAGNVMSGARMEGTVTLNTR